MNEYQTPRRRHSSLFQRMEDEINKISKKLSAAKQHRQTHTHSRKFTLSHPPSQLPCDTPSITTRRYQEEDNSSKQLTRKTKCLADRTNFESTRPPVRKLRFGFEQSEGHQVKKLEQVKMMKAVCEEQAFKVGYIRAESRERQNYYQQQKSNYKRQQVYLTKLAQGYRLKIEKYKKIIGEEDSLELSVNDL